MTSLYNAHFPKFKKNSDAAGPLGDLGHTAPVLIPQYLRNPISFQKASQKKL